MIVQYLLLLCPYDQGVNSPSPPPQTPNIILLVLHVYRILKKEICFKKSCEIKNVTLRMRRLHLSIYISSIIFIFSYLKLVFMDDIITYLNLGFKNEFMSSMTLLFQGKNCSKHCQTYPRNILLTDGNSKRDT